ncbi:TPA: hypothetical protein ACGQTX_005987, partial [Raoultella ornithinolytica]
ATARRVSKTSHPPGCTIFFSFSFFLKSQTVYPFCACLFWQKRPGPFRRRISFNDAERSFFIGK